MGRNRQECVGQVGIAVAFDCSEIPQAYFDEKVGDAAIRRAQAVNSEGGERTVPTQVKSEPHHLAKPIAHATQHDVNSSNGQTGVSQYGQVDVIQPQQKGAITQEQTTESQPTQSVEKDRLPQQV